MGVEKVELRRRLILEELGGPVCIRHRREGTGDGLPFCYTEAGLCQSCESAKYYDAEDAGGAAQ